MYHSDWFSVNRHHCSVFALLDNSQEYTHVHYSLCGEKAHMWLLTGECRFTECAVNVFINWLIWAWNANHNGARLSYVNTFAVGTALWLEPSEELLFVLFKWRLKSLVWHLDIADKLFWHTADKGGMEQQHWITLTMGSILIDILT